jgi:branched-chain amino acid transport system substrate-binding protein
VGPVNDWEEIKRMRNRVKLLVALTALVLGTVVVASAMGAAAAQPGVTAKQITIGGTFPLTGPAALYGTIPVAEQAYFSYVNAKGGVNGRKIKFIYYDDVYDPSQTVPLTQKLVEQNKVFADYGSLGTAPNLAIRSYLNTRKVPQVLVATGDSYWGSQYKKFPWTIGFQPDYPGESKIYAEFLKTKVKSAKIGVLYQNDAYGQNYLNALKTGLGKANQKMIVDAEPFDVTAPDVTQQMLKLKASGANVFVDFATPKPSITALVTATKIGWHPAATFVNNVSASSTFMALAAQSGADISGAITATYLKDVTDPKQANDPGVKLYKTLMAKYYAKGDLTNANNIFGMASAWTMAYALQHAGKTPTRAGLMRALTHLNTTANPFLLKGVKLHTTPTERFPIDQQILSRWSGGAKGRWVNFGHIFSNAR